MMEISCPIKKKRRVLVTLGLLAIFLVGVALGSRNMDLITSAFGASEVINIRSSRAVSQVTGQSTRSIGEIDMFPQGISINGTLNMLGHGIHNVSNLLGASPIRIDSSLVVNGSINLTGDLQVQDQSVLDLFNGNTYKKIDFENNFTLEVVNDSLVFKKSGETLLKLTEDGNLYLKGTLKENSNLIN